MATISFRQAAVAIAVDNRPEPKSLLQDVTLELTEHRIGVIGANGSGKSTLLRLINGLVQPSSGTVSVAGADTVRAVRAVRRQVGFVFTDPLSQLVMPTGREDVELSLRRPVRNGAERRRLAESALERLGLLPLADQSIYELSGGERQRVAFARAIVLSPALIVADEPTSMMDADLRRELVQLMERLRNQHQIAFLYITHDIALARSSCDRIVVMDEGCIVEEWGGNQLTRGDHHPATQRLLDAAQTLAGV